MPSGNPRAAPAAVAVALLPVVPQAVEPPPPLLVRPADCRLALFCLVWDFWFWSCGLLFRSKVCAQPMLTRNREQESARRKKFFFTGPPLSESQKEHAATRFHARYQGFSESGMPQQWQQLCSS